MPWPWDIIIHPDQILVTRTMQYAVQRNKWWTISRTPSFPPFTQEEASSFSYVCTWRAFLLWPHLINHLRDSWRQTPCNWLLQKKINHPNIKLITSEKPVETWGRRVINYSVLLSVWKRVSKGFDLSFFFLLSLIYLRSMTSPDNICKRCFSVHHSPSRRDSTFCFLLWPQAAKVHSRRKVSIFLQGSFDFSLHSKHKVHLLHVVAGCVTWLSCLCFWQRLSHTRR